MDTDEGIKGIGEALVGEGLHRPVAEAIKPHKHYLVGEDPRNRNLIKRKLARYPFAWRNGRLINSVSVAVDIALLDIAEKYYDEPVWRLLGGTSRGGPRLRYAFNAFNEGNWWGDWQPPEHPDSNNDGIVDEPRPIKGANNYDNYPLVIGYSLYEDNVLYVDNDWIGGSRVPQELEYGENAFTSIENAVNSADPLENNKIMVFEGFYDNSIEEFPITIDVENLTLTSSETLENTIIDGEGVNEYLLKIIGSEIDLSGFTIENSWGRCSGIEIKGRGSVISDILIQEKSNGGTPLNKLEMM
ncbi:hypothetical protein AKJ37_03555 [candidate division MSBL1 archaeon SCGC-AAA259I09]|uniref:Mandelate racemase/muconate lactonizing enzyme N-terminal domain-containing protein n=1 Tax=candidate division MSBL1 archaeon SCGC-AAA259I09 TaxID=1698267 RepID=A0A133USG7_9EURY|nr:hypothetical protein AKJ37_03555 [candidate division MSBL1 archaeon SCGC-AAA259I09]